MQALRLNSRPDWALFSEATVGQETSEADDRGPEAQNQKYLLPPSGYRQVGGPFRVFGKSFSLSYFWSNSLSFLSLPMMMGQGTGIQIGLNRRLVAGNICAIQLAPRRSTPCMRFQEASPASAPPRLHEAPEPFDGMNKT